MYGDPEELDRLAARLRARAVLVREHAGDHVRAGESAHWVSAAGQAYRDAAARDRSDADTAADELEAAAQALARHAQTVREQLAAIARAEQAVRSRLSEFWHRAEQARDAVTRAVTDEVDSAARRLAADPWIGLPFDPRRLPGPGDLDWLNLHRALDGGHG